MKALVFNNFGGPEVLSVKEIEEPERAKSAVIVRMKAIGLNFADVYRRKGNYHLVGEPPYILGYEGAGVIEYVGEDVHHVKVGDRVGFADVPHANAELVSVPADKLLPLPDGISFETAASVLLQGLTAQYLTDDSHPVKKGETVLVHAAAGGVGQLLTQMIKMKGGQVIGLTSSDDKAAVAKKAGAAHVFLYESDWVNSIKDVTNNIGVDVVYESVGQTLMNSFEATKTGGTVVFFGMAGGDPDKIDPRMLMDTSKALIGGDLWNVLTTHEERKRRTAELFEWIMSGKILLDEPTLFSMENGADAHRLLESRKSTGKILLIP
ncbi:quinone oxidoreductase [Peribacillus muralis]|uniref:quinone oxidoreductase family protein n=1 Tax=Peribacillus muralis TaxID=264697 RepID=UPI001F4EE247|nr:quinone oxidoreductase [Peribacillus muralis]MCK1995198.1 quinone oxidoreductase [Peribacillus muralis]MCK2015719.1 quinone oxidoreductase [Peribacillus muralis]